MWIYNITVTVTYMVKTSFRFGNLYLIFVTTSTIFEIFRFWRLLKAVWNRKVRTEGLEWRLETEGLQLKTSNYLWLKSWGWMVAQKKVATDSLWPSVAKEILGLKAWDWGVAFEDFQLNACDWRDRQVAIGCLQLGGPKVWGWRVGLNGCDWGLT